MITRIKKALVLKLRMEFNLDVTERIGSDLMREVKGLSMSWKIGKRVSIGNFNFKRTCIVQQFIKYMLDVGNWQK